jgi:hypothetical protein
MRDSNSEAEWLSFLRDWQGWIYRLLDAQQAYEEVGGQIPQVWLDLVKCPNANTIQNLWVKTENSLPRFTDYLSWAILDARIAESEAGYLLVYKLKDWEEIIGLYDSEEVAYENGFMMAGMPIKPSVLADFELEIGSMPDSLRDLWLTHGFVQLRYYNFLVSLNPKQQKLALSPTLFSSRRDSWQKDRVLDCLGIADLTGGSVPSLTRQPGTQAWLDYIVSVDRFGETMSESSQVHLDDMLSDWLLRRWEGKEVLGEERGLNNRSV